MQIVLSLLFPFLRSYIILIYIRNEVQKNKKKKGKKKNNNRAAKTDLSIALKNFLQYTREMLA